MESARRASAYRADAMLALRSGAGGPDHAGWDGLRNEMPTLAPEASATGSAGRSACPARAAEFRCQPARPDVAADVEQADLRARDLAAMFSNPSWGPSTSFPKLTRPSCTPRSSWAMLTPRSARLDCEGIARPPESCTPVTFHRSTHPQRARKPCTLPPGIGDAELYLRAAHVAFHDATAPMSRALNLTHAAVQEILREGRVTLGGPCCSPPDRTGRPPGMNRGHWLDAAQGRGAGGGCHGHRRDGFFRRAHRDDGRLVGLHRLLLAPSGVPALARCRPAAPVAAQWDFRASTGPQGARLLRSRSPAFVAHQVSASSAEVFTTRSCSPVACRRRTISSPGRAGSAR